MRKRTRTIGAVAGLFGGALLLAGCGQAAGDAAANAANSAAQQDVSASNCSAADFSVDLNAQPGKPGQFLLAMTNNSDKTCTVGGWVNLTPLNAANQPIQVPTKNVEYPGAPKDFQLKPHTTAFAGVQAEIGDKGDPNSYVATGFTAQPSDMDGQVNANLVGVDPMQGIALKGLKTGTLQPTSNGALLP